MNKNIKLGKYEIVFNLIRNQYSFKLGNNILFRSKTKKRVLEYVETLHQENNIDIMELHHFMGFVDDMELTRNKPMIGRNRSVKVDYDEY